MSSASVVVIILVVVVVAIAGATLTGGPQPATPHEPRNDAPPDPDDLAFPVAAPSVDVPPIPYREPDPEPGAPSSRPHDLELDDDEDGFVPDEGVPEIRGARERVRALVRLGATVVVLGGAAAALLGGGALVGFRLLDRALG